MKQCPPSPSSFFLRICTVMIYNTNNILQKKMVFLGKKKKKKPPIMKSNEIKCFNDGK